MIRKTIIWFKNLRMSSQIMIVNLFIIIFAVFLTITTSYVQQEIFFTYIQEQEQAISLKQEKSIVNNISRDLRLYIEQKNYQIILNLWHTYQMFNQFSKTQFEYQINVNQFQDCVEQDQIEQFNIVYNSNNICQGIYTQQSQYDGQAILMNKTLSFLTSFSELLIADEENRILFVDIPNNNIYAQYPKMFKYKNFNPKTRPWYINHITQYNLNPNQEYFYSPIFNSIRSQKPHLALTYSWILNSTLFAIVAQVQEIYDQNIQNIPLSIFLVNQEGAIVLTTMPNISQKNIIITITNETYTGFNQTDWELIKQNSQKKISRKYQEVAFYLENKIFNKTVFVNAFKFEKENLTLIVFKNVTYEMELEVKIEEQVHAIRIKMIQDIQIQFGVSVFLVILTTSIIRCICAPLFNLIQLINIHVLKIGNNLNSELFKMAIKSKKQTDFFSSLTYQFLGLKDLQSRRSDNKNQRCQQIEEIKYNYNYQELDCSKIQESILLIPSQGLQEIFNQNNSFQKPILMRSFSQKKLWVNTNDQQLYRIILIKQIFQQLFQKNDTL